MPLSGVTARLRQRQSGRQLCNNITTGQNAKENQVPTKRFLLEGAANLYFKRTFDTWASSSQEQRITSQAGTPDPLTWTTDQSTHNERFIGATRNRSILLYQISLYHGHEDPFRNEHVQYHNHKNPPFNSWATATAATITTKTPPFTKTMRLRC